MTLGAAPARQESRGQAPGRARRGYLRLLGWAFALFSTVRVAAYLPTLWALWEQGRSDQHSVLTWLTWTGANLTMAAWLHEHGGAGTRAAVWVHVANGILCGAILALIIALR